MTTKKYMKGKEAADYLGISQSTLRRYDENGWINTIRTPGNQRLYDVLSFVDDEEIEDIPIENKNDVNVCYCRVSTHGQKDDLERQKEYMIEKYPSYELIDDIGSGINFKRKGLLKIINYALEGRLRKLVVAYKDRLCRIGYSLIEYILLTYSQTEIIVDSHRDETINEEIANDLLQIINVYSAKINGMRKYKKKKEKY